MELLEPVRDLLGGGTLSLWLAVGGLVLLWLAVKAVETVVKVALVIVGGTLLVGIAPWSGTAIDTAPAVCATKAVESEVQGWPAFLAKRVTVEEISPDARCDEGGAGLAAGTAGVRVRTFFDVPFQTWAVDGEGARPTTSLPGT